MKRIFRIGEPRWNGRSCTARVSKAAVASVTSILVVLLTPVVGVTDSNPCGYFNVIDMPDPPGDNSSGSPPYVDILNLQLRQYGELVQFKWDAAAPLPQNQEHHFFIFFDTDRNSSTGQQWGGVGAELKVAVDERAGMDLFDASGNLIGQVLDLPVFFTDEGFVLNLEKAHIPTDHFNLYFESSGHPGWWDHGSVHEIYLQPATDPVEIRIEADQVVLEADPRLFNIVEPGDSLQLTASIIRGGIPTPLDPGEVTFSVSHSRPDLIPDPTAVISVSPAGVATYNSEGFVFVQAISDECRVASGEVILATGDVFGDPQAASVVAVFPTDLQPEWSDHTFGDMMSSHPEMMGFLDTAHEVSSELYGGFLPFDGDAQILAIVQAEGQCGGPGNPLQTSSCCYMNCGDASPQYNVIIHEMGHNFSFNRGMESLLWSDEGQIATSGFIECVASLPIIYFEQEVVHNPAAYGIDPTSYVYSYYRDNIDYYCPDSEAGLEEFEQMITASQSDGIFDNDGLFDGVRVWCSFFQAFSCDYIDGANPYHHHMTRRFLHIFGDSDLPGFVPEKVETYFAAAYSVAAGMDMRSKLSFWGFEIDNAHYDEILPLIQQRLNEVDGRIFKSGFESGDTSGWSGSVPRAGS